MDISFFSSFRIFGFIKVVVKCVIFVSKLDLKRGVNFLDEFLCWGGLFRFEVGLFSFVRNRFICFYFYRLRLKEVLLFKLEVFL